MVSTASEGQVPSLLSVKGVCMRGWKFLHSDVSHFGFARRLREELRKRKWSCGDLAVLLDVGAPTVSRWIGGEKLPSATMLERLKTVLEIKGNMIWEE